MRGTAVRSRIPFAIPFSLLLALAVCSPAHGQELRAFTVDDALSVRGVSIIDATSDARWIAARVTTARSRMGTDHFRFGDPTYLAPSTNELLVLDAATGETRAVFDDPVQTRDEAWSPDGRRLAFLRAVDGALRLEVYERERDRVRAVRLRPARELAPGVLQWLPDGSGVVVAVRAEGWRDRARQAYRALEEGPIVVQDSREDFLSWDAVRDLGDLAELAVVSLEAGSIRILAPEGPHTDVRLDPDGEHLTYTVARPQRTSYRRGAGTEYEMIRLGLAPGSEPVTLVPASEDRIRPDFSPDGSRFAWSEEGDVFVRAVTADSAVNLTTDHRDALTATDSTRRSYSLETWSPDGRALLLRAQDGLWMLSADGGSPSPVLERPGTSREEWREGPEWDVVEWTTDGQLYVATSARDRWERSLLRVDLDWGTEDVLVSDSNLYRQWTVAEDGSRIVFRRSDGDRPDEVWAAHGDFSEARPLTDLNAFLGEVALARSELVSYLDVDGNELHGILYHPPGRSDGERRPLVAEIYEDFFDNGYNYSAQMLAAQGWFVLRPSVEFEIGFPGEAWMKGVTAAINTLVDRGLADNDRLGVHGTSYGGYAANLLITQTDRFAAAINISGKVNIVSFLGDSEKITTRNYNAAEETQDRIGATLWEQPQKYIAHSAVMYADRIDTPLLLLTGQGDWNVPATNTREMYYALRRLGKEVVWVNYMRAGHGAGRAGLEEDFRDHWRRIVEWYGEHFEWGEDPMTS
ncbi:MAG: S9 family peptidase [Gemmatimonadales bacterium]|nr:MAG: S9 family peptidase [Gemmatimonadales bacterium]